MKYRYIIFGGSGFIGTHFCNLLTKNGDEFVILDIVEPIEKKYNFIFTDIRESIDFRPSKEKENIIINLAAIHKTPGHPSHDYFDTNLKGAENICSFARRNDIKTIVFTSSISVYGTYEEIKSEKTLTKPDIPYGISKLTSEYIHKKWYAEDSINSRLIILRPGVVFGMYEKANFTRLVNSLENKYFAYVGRKDVKKACIYVKDLTQAIHELAIDKTINLEVYNVSYNPSLTIQEIVNIITTKCNNAFPRFVVPKWIIIFLSKILFYIFNKKDFNPSRMQKLVISNNIDSQKVNEKIKFNFGFSNAVSDWIEETNFLINKKIY